MIDIFVIPAYAEMLEEAAKLGGCRKNQELMIGGLLFFNRWLCWCHES